MNIFYIIREKNTQFCNIGITDNLSKKIDEMSLFNPREFVVEKTVELDKTSISNLYNVIRGKMNKYQTDYPTWYNLSKSNREYFIGLIDSYTNTLKNN